MVRSLLQKDDDAARSLLYEYVLLLFCIVLICSFFESFANLFPCEQGKRSAASRATSTTSSVRSRNGRNGKIGEEKDKGKESYKSIEEAEKEKEKEGDEEEGDEGDGEEEEGEEDGPKEYLGSDKDKDLVEMIKNDILEVRTCSLH